MRGNIMVLTFTGIAHSGKDTAVKMVKKYFEEKGKRVLSLAYADLLKALLKRNFGYDESDKEKYRSVLQQFGTNFVRRIEPDFWVHETYHMIDLLSKKKSEEELDELRNEMLELDIIDDNDAIHSINEIIQLEEQKYDVFLISDARFLNELRPYPYNLCYNIFNVKIDRDIEGGLEGEEASHESEQLAKTAPNDLFHMVVNNNGTLEDLDRQCLEIVEYTLGCNASLHEVRMETLKGLLKMEDKNEEQ